MKIGDVEFGSNPLFLAPMEDVTDIGFRHLCKRYGAAMVYTEFVSAVALVRYIQSTINKLTQISSTLTLVVLSKRLQERGQVQECYRIYPCCSR